tara:strand:+ start:176 stop:289 length:114 start_codon:yes stop_codon:yes gene_type:complete
MGVKLDKPVKLAKVLKSLKMGFPLFFLKALAYTILKR